MVLYAYSDGFAGQWGLTLYKDGDFQVYLPASEAAGRFQLVGDTVVLHYQPPAPGLPEAYFISRKNRKIDELHQVAGKWTPTSTNNWATLHIDSTQYYQR
jgi:hypothetical protein